MGTARDGIVRFIPDWISRIPLPSLTRREPVTLFGGAAAAWPLASQAQQPTAPLIGFLSARSPDESADLVAAFRRGLGEDGYIQGRTVAIEYRWADGHFDQLPALAAELVRHRVAVIAAVTTPGQSRPRRRPRSFQSYSLRGGSCEPWARRRPQSSRGNVTGVSLITFELLRKRMQLIREIVPDASTIGLLVNPANATAEPLRREAQEAAVSLGRQIVYVNASSARDFEKAFAALIEQRAGALVVSPDPFFNGRSKELGALAARHMIPAIAEVRDFAVAGGLASYGTTFADAYRQAGIYAGCILKGAKPAELPVMQATTVQLVINVRTTRTFGLTIPLPLLGRADEVIE